NMTYKKRIADYVDAHEEEARDKFEEKYTALFRAHPAKDSFDSETIIKEILNDEALMKHFK
ncbi:MAG: RNA polymerase subunit sigma-70, partial [Thermonemataceae bacterium]